MHKFTRWIARRHKIILLSTISAALLIFLTYVVDSLPYPLGGEVTVGQWIERIRHIVSHESEHIPDSIYPVNVAYDRVLVDYNAKVFKEEKDSPVEHAGCIDVTDRGKLLRFLQIADSAATYRYIMLDVRFGDDIKTDSVTKQLFALIAGMERVVYAIHKDTPVTPDAPEEKGAFGDYYTTFLVSDVVKYPVVKQDEAGIMIPSIPTRMYETIGGGEISTLGILTFDNGQLCHRSVYPTFPVRFSDWGRRIDSGLKFADDDVETESYTLQYKNLGTDLLTYSTPDKIAKEIEGKIVVIGDFVDDIHDTYYGRLPGALINLNTYIALCRGAHRVSLIGLCCVFILYFALSWAIIRHHIPMDFIPARRRPKSNIPIILISFVGYSFILTCYGLMVYLCFDSIYSVVLPGIYFTTFQTCVKIRK